MTLVAHRSLDDLPDEWDFERFTVVDAGDNRIALHNAVHNRFVRIVGKQVGQRPH